MEVLITGGAGFIGSAVARAALARGWRVRILDNMTTGRADNVPKAVDLVEGDIRDRHAVALVLRGVDAVFHLAAVVGNVRSFEDSLGDASTNVLGTRELLVGMREARVARLVYSSSAAIFGEPIALPISEGHTTNPLSPYGVSKLAAEKDCLCFGQAFGWRVSALRYFNVYGLNQRFDAYGNVIPIFVRQLLGGESLVIYGDGQQTRDFVNVNDVAEANCRAAELSNGGIFNIGSGVATTINQVVRLLSLLVQHQPTVVHSEPRAGEVRHCTADISRATATLGVIPATPLATGLGEYVNWVRGL